MTPVESRIAAKTRIVPPPTDEFATPVEGPCWEWTGGLRQGYGHTTAYGRRWGVHRLMAFECGMDIEGKVLDHLCRNRACCNPMHLEAVSTQQNIARGLGQKHVSRESCYTCKSKNGVMHHKPGGGRYWKCYPCLGRKLNAKRAEKKAAGIGRAVRGAEAKARRRARENARIQTDEELRRKRKEWNRAWHEREKAQRTAKGTP